MTAFDRQDEGRRLLRRAEAAEASFHGLLEAAPDAIVVSNREGRIVLVNAQSEALFGYRREELLDQPVELLLPEYLRAVHAQHRATYYAAPHVRSLGRGFGLFCACRRKDGHDFDADISLSPLQTENGLLVISIIRDVTEHKRALAALRESEARFRRLAESNIIGILSGDLGGPITEANDAFLQMVGYTREELRAGKLWWDAITPAEYQPQDERAIAELKTSGVATPQEKEYTRKDGSRVPVLVGVALMEGSQETCIAYALDLTERKQAEAARLLLVREQAARVEAEAQRRRLEAILEHIPEGVVIVTAPDARLSLWNRAAERLVGRLLQGSAADGAWQSRPIALTDGWPYAHEDHPFLRALRGDIVLGEELVLEHPDRGRTILLTSAAPISDEQGRVGAAVAVFQDITQRKTLEQLKDEFLSLAAHELRTPLAVIKGNSQLLLRRAARGMASLSEGEMRLLRTIDERTDYVVGLMGDLLDLSRIDLGRLQLHPEPTDLAALLREVTAQQQLLHPDTPFVLEGADHSLGGTWDRARLEQVFANLLDNAVKYSPPGRRVRVRLSAGEGQARIAVQDEGIGIPAKDLPRLFERHFRAGNVEQSPSGLGLGLYITSQIVQHHGGRIWAESIEGEGSTFSVDLPWTANTRT